MMTQAFYTGLSGLKSNQTAIDLKADNLSNVSTVGFRSYEPEFASMFETSINTTAPGTSNNGIGYGVQIQTTSMNKDTGTMLHSEKSTDLAIIGEGWFGIQGENEALYTRAGNFTFDRENDLVTQDGHYVLGTMGTNISEDNKITDIVEEVKLGGIDSQEKLRFPKDLSYPTEPTKNAKFLGNLGTEDEIRTIGASVVDKDNNKNHLKLTFIKSAQQPASGMQWDIKASIQSLNGEEIYGTKTGIVKFDTDGSLISNTLKTIDNKGTEINIDLGNGFDGLVSINNLNISASNITDGAIGGDLEGYTINKNAEIIATFTNGQQTSVGKIAIFHFRNEQGLDRASGARFSASSNSGRPMFYQNQNGENIIGANILNYNLESSNVNLPAGLTDLIILQRAYDANSKSISTANEMMQKALQMDA
ncbi:flagellar hook-basal body complex protein [Sulfurimonas sp.]|uniref:flagellar hook-basal body complex protein n=1 Tax=Sulfurimonas sp. TaxID=2022749 RepID=UPI0025F502A7|nr:flagellar hook-basal body complex protein [Sulfurimonas sp.]